MDLYQLKVDNEVKLYEYKLAKNTLQIIKKNFFGLLSPHDKEDLANSLKIWTALENEPKQEVIIKKTNSFKMMIDKAQLKNLTASNKNDSINLIFDTGANLSTASASTAVRLNMKILPSEISIGTITGDKAKAQIAICPLLKLGDIEIRNAVFLVLKDEQLYIKSIDYQINGILGFPVIEALREIQINKEGYFTVPKQETKMIGSSNLAIDGLTPELFLNDNVFTFDTGATNTILYSAYYKENKKEIDSNYTISKVAFAGAGGRKEFDGFIINKNFKIGARNISLKNIQLLKEKIKSDENVFGNIGQDFIGQFDEMTINFNQMFIQFN